MLINLKQNNFNIEVDLPLSKSESNRALMIALYLRTQRLRDAETQRFCDYATLRLSDLITSQLSNSDDTVLLKNLLEKINQYIYHYKQSLLSVDVCPLTLDCANAGTVFRFLMTAVANLQFTIKNEQLTVDNKKSSQTLRFLLTGSERMKSRPIDSLVDALRSFGVSIEYKEKEGYPPVLIIISTHLGDFHVNSCGQDNTSDSCEARRNRVEVSAEQSSQFASSLLLAAPTWKNGLELHLTGNLSSLPYIDMTINMMRQCGINVKRDDRDIIVRQGTYNIENIKIESDWSAAAFWYEAVALSAVKGQQSTAFLLKNLNVNSLQGDAIVMKMFEDLGVETMPSDKGVVIKKTTTNSHQRIFNFQFSTFNFKDCPDLFPAVIATCAGLQIDATFTGLKNLSIKESNRKMAMINELNKINFSFEDNSDDVLKMYCPEKLPYFTEETPITFNNYDDHRIAMALSILSLKIGAINMENPAVVSKSYPQFYEAIGVNPTSDS